MLELYILTAVMVEHFSKVICLTFLGNRAGTPLEYTYLGIVFYKVIRVTFLGNHAGTPLEYTHLGNLVKELIVMMKL